MSNYRHTPGPWHWDGNPCDYDRDQEAPWLIGPDDQPVITGEIHIRNEHDRNALEAVPDMLAALQEVLKAPGLQSGLQALCAAAVAKATGRSIEDVITGA